MRIAIHVSTVDVCTDCYLAKGIIPDGVGKFKRSSDVAYNGSGNIVSTGGLSVRVWLR